MRAVLVMAFALLAAERFLFGVLEGVGSMVMGSMAGAREVGFEEEGPAVPSESEVVVVKGLRECLRGVLLRFTRCLGDAGEDGGLDNWIDDRANLAFLVVVGGGVLGERSLLKLEYGLLCAVERLERRGE